MASPIPDLVSINKARGLYNKLKSKRAVAREMKRDEKQIRRWLAYSEKQLAKLSTGTA